MAAQKQFEESARNAPWEELAEIESMATDGFGFDCQCSNCEGWYSIWLRSQLSNFYGEWISVTDNEEGQPEGWYCALPECLEAANGADEENNREECIEERSEDEADLLK